MRKSILLFCVILLALTGCGLTPKAETIEGQERDDILAYAEPMADSLFQAMNANDYATFSKDFDATMAKAMDEKAFNQFNERFDSLIGNYQSREVAKVERIENIIVISYTAKFEQEEGVAVRFNLREGQPPQVAGLWFDSPKLRQ